MYIYINIYICIYIYIYIYIHSKLWNKHSNDTVHEYMKCISNTFNSTRDLSLGLEASISYKKKTTVSIFVAERCPRTTMASMSTTTVPGTWMGWKYRRGRGEYEHRADNIAPEKSKLQTRDDEICGDPRFFLTQKWIIKTLLALPYAALARFVSATKENSSQCLVLRTTADSQVGEPVAGEWGLPLGDPLGTLQVEPGNQGAVLILKKDSRDTWKFPLGDEHIKLQPF